VSREVVLATENIGDFEVEDGDSALDMIAVLEATLLPYLTAEQERLQAESTFLKEVHEGITQGAPLETSSSIYVDGFLDSILGQLGAI
jgi:hypothetical protein